MTTPTVPIPIYGLDFTSAPGVRKPITCVQCMLEGRYLRFIRLLSFANFTACSSWLHSPGPWVAAFDFPFGLPPILIEDLSWPCSWADYVSHIASLGKERFIAILTAYMTNRPPGTKLLLRVADQLAGSISPMMLYRVPVARMFFEGAPRLLASGVRIEPCLPRGDQCLALEGYPALVAA